MNEAIEQFLESLRGSDFRLSERSLREIRGHLEDSARRLRDSGIPEDEAANRAVAAFGSHEDFATSLARAESHGGPAGTLLRRRSGALGLAFVLPSVTFIVVNLLHFNLGVQGPLGAVAEEAASWSFSLAGAVRDIVVIGGPLLALGTFILGAFHAQVEREERGLTASISFQPNRAHLVTALLSALAMGLLAVYLVTENNFPA